MSDAIDSRDGIEAFVAKWRARWPEWAVAEVFVPASQREAALAWASLRQELADAAWAGADPRPGEAKLAWWQEELRGWTAGARRHPLGAVLQRRATAWAALADAVPALRLARERPRDAAEAAAALRPCAAAMARLEAEMFCDPVADNPSASPFTPATDAAVAAVTAPLLLQRVLADATTAAPLALVAHSGEAAAPAAWRLELLARWPRPATGPTPRRIEAALARARLRRGDPAMPLPAWAALWSAWRAARG